jgi:hypothetical protein
VRFGLVSYALIIVSLEETKAQQGRRKGNSLRRPSSAGWNLAVPDMRSFMGSGYNNQKQEKHAGGG